MAKPTSNPILNRIRRVLDDPGVKNCADQELLRRFLAEQEVAAFEGPRRLPGRAD
jgi:hypothetical protein